MIKYEYTNENKVSYEYTQINPVNTTSKIGKIFDINLMDFNCGMII